MGIGDYVINLDHLCKIVDIFDNGDYLVENPRLGRWRAVPALCKPDGEDSEETPNVNEQIIIKLKELVKLCEDYDVPQLNIYVTKQGYGSAFTTATDIEVSIFEDGSAQINSNYNFLPKALIKGCEIGGSKNEDVR